jgi:putative ABC transport system substrate-binding protein
VQIDYRWGPGDTGRYRTYAAELVALAPDVILVSGGATPAIQQVTRIDYLNEHDRHGAPFV